MLPKKERMQRADFKVSLLNQQRIHTKNLALTYSPTPLIFKAVVTVSKKVSKLAVQRNEIRRSLYGVLEKKRPTLKKGIYMIRVKTSAIEVSKQQLRSELQQLIGRIENAR